jgi:hypothetical protein
MKRRVWRFCSAVNDVRVIWNMKSLNCNNLALCWLLRRVKDVGQLSQWTGSECVILHV